MPEQLSDKLNLLVAFPYMKAEMIQVIQAHKSRIRLLVDSGAFTGWKSGHPISLDDYCLFLESLPVEPWRYFALDVVGDPDASLRNYETMLARGFKPIPIFTRGEDPQVLERYYGTSDVVGIGGLVGTSKNKGFVKGIMKLAADRRVHLLGFTNLPFLKVYRPYMCDCSSWEMGGRYARPSVYCGGGKMSFLNRDVVRKRVPDFLAQAITRLGFQMSDFYKPGAWTGGYSEIRRLGAASYVKLSMDVGDNLGTRFFLASTTGLASEILLEQFYKLKGLRDEINQHSFRGHGLSDGAGVGAGAEA